MPRKIVIIGANAAGVHAANAARKTDPKSEITLIEKEPYPAYSRCGIPYVLAGEIPRFEDLTAFPSSHYRMMKFDLRLETQARSINPDDKIVLIEEKEGNFEALRYD
ncbi:MAG: NAD(P)/FAD-dependent oxidoreductase, partial [Candidatus Bathyarchaeota archaeon]|nr:NAD(P)/FAD-dependent oxidoreductase [Candidatus Bathyarchaeota archaeon]